MEQPIHLLGIDDLVLNPVWEFVNDDSRDETLVRPVEKLPVPELDGKVVGTEVVLAGGARVWAMLANVDIHDADWTKHVITVSIERDGAWFTLSRYHDFDYAKRGPHALAAFLERDLSEVFPISYDLRPHVIGNVDALVGRIHEAPPAEKLTRADIIAMSVQRLRR